MTDEELVKHVYPEAKLVNGWATRYHQTIKVFGIQIKEKKKVRWLIFLENGYRQHKDVSDNYFWNLGAKRIEKKFLKQLES